MKFDRQYFINYAGSGQSYDKVFTSYSGISDCLELFDYEGAPRIRTMSVLGTATGKILRVIHKKLKIRAYGCEISPWAYGKIKPIERKRIQNVDMREYLKTCKPVDLLFSNSLMYLESDSIPALLKNARKKCDYFYFEGSYVGLACKDPYRKTFRSRVWWDARFREAGFGKVRAEWGRSVYLWC